MADAIMSIFSQIMVYLNGEDLQNTLGQNLSSYMYDAYDLVKDLQTIVVGPLALSILALFILLEFQRISLKVEGAGGAPMLGFEMIIKSFIKFAICYVVILRIQDILDGIIVITANLSAKVLAIGASGKVQNATEQVRRAVNDLDFWEKIVILLIMCILFLVALVVRVLIQVTIYLRFLELYIFSAMAPIPMGVLPSQEFSSMTKSFFKNFASTGLQSTFIALVLIIYPMIFARIMKDVGEGIWGIILGLTIYMIALLLSINKTKGWAKMILSAS
ncbi:type IV secretion system protein [Enterococcus durans]|uniref:type IV secretion system protein n=1 Tax=Enterococcus durans TaxID=53345 RepID=UPI0020743B7A|nr:type IV secretion system protein [Enterococcus durans]